MINCLCCITNYFPNLVVQSNKHLYYCFCELGSKAHFVEWLWFRISQKLQFRYWQGCGLMWGLRQGGVSGLLVWLSAGPSSPLPLGWGSCFPAACLLLATLGCLPGAPLQREPHTCQLPFLRASEHSPRGPSVTSDIVAVLHSPLKNYTSYSPPQMRGCHTRVTKVDAEEQRPPQEHQNDVNLSSHPDHESLQASHRYQQVGSEQRLNHSEIQCS